MSRVLTVVPRLAGAALVAAMVAGGAVSAQATTASDGLWYFDAFNVQAAHDAGFTGDGVTVAVIDSQVNLDVPTLREADVTTFPSPICEDANGEPIAAESTDLGAASHGTNVLSYLVGNGDGYGAEPGVRGIAPDATVLYYAAIPLSSEGEVLDCETSADVSGVPASDSVGRSMLEAMKAGADVISISSGLNASDQLSYAQILAANLGIPVVAAQPNRVGLGADIFEGGFPAADNGAIAVEAIDPTGAPQTTDGRPNVSTYTSVAGPGVGVLLQGDSNSGSWEQQRVGNGTSFATPAVAGFLAVAKQKWPEATGNQLITSLLTNTGTGNHPITYENDGLGFGIASLTNMLEVDPTQYSDTSPAIWQTDRGPTAEVIADPLSYFDWTPTGTPTADEMFDLQLIREKYGPGSVPENDNPDAGADDAVSGIPGWIPIAIGIGVLLVVAAIVLVIVFATRRARGPQHPTEPTGGQ